MWCFTECLDAVGWIAESASCLLRLHKWTGSCVIDESETCQDFGTALSLYHWATLFTLSLNLFLITELEMFKTQGVSASKMTYTLPCRVTHSLICLIWTFSWWVSFGKLICQIVITALYRNTLWHIKNFFSKLWPVLSNMQDGFLVCFHLLTVLWFSEGGWIVYQSHCRWNPNIVRHDFLSLFSISCIICLATFY